VTAQSFAAAFNRDANPEMKSPATIYMHEIVGANAVVAGKAKTISGVRVLAPYRLRIELTKPLGDLPARLTDPLFCPVARGTPIDPAGIENPAGSGPYYVASVIPNRQIVLKRNPLYRGGRPAKVDEIVWTEGETRDACLNDVEQDRIDYCPPPGFPASAARDLAARYGINKKNGQFFVSPSLATTFFVFNHDRAAFRGAGQIPLAKAINYAIDRPALARPYGYLAGQRADRMLPAPIAEGGSIYSVRGADQKTARKWLARAKLKPSRLVLYASSSPSGVAAAGVFAFDLKQIGIDVDVRFSTWRP
jgi:ABC-type oligopeptide transport system substrate-binding subunit